MVPTPQWQAKVRREQMLPADDGDKQARSSPGRARISRNPSRRESRSASAEPVCSCAFLLYLCTRDRGCSMHPAFPAPSVSREGETKCKARANHVARTQSCVPTHRCHRPACAQLRTWTGRPSTPRPIGSITTVSGILDHPHAGDDTEDAAEAFAQQIERAAPAPACAPLWPADNNWNIPHPGEFSP